MYHIFCIHSSVEGHLGSFQFLAIINKAAMHIMEPVSCLYVGASFGNNIRNKKQSPGIKTKGGINMIVTLPVLF